MDIFLIIFIVAIVLVIITGPLAYKLQKIEKFPFLLTICGILIILRNYNSNLNNPRSVAWSCFLIIIAAEILITNLIVVLMKYNKTRQLKHLWPILITFTIILTSFSIRFYYSHLDSPILFIAGVEPSEYTKLVRINQNKEIISPPKTHYGLTLVLRKNGKYVIYLSNGESDDCYHGEYTIAGDTLKLLKDRKDHLPTNWLIYKDSIYGLDKYKEAFFINYNKLKSETIK
jgi:hypothetical protein